MNKCKILFKVIILLYIIAALISELVIPVYADVGPKPSLTIVVRGLNTEKYWLDLLVTDDAKYSWLDISESERKQVSKLAEYDDQDGFHPALLGGTRVPLRGNLRGEKENSDGFVHRFNYVGVPRTFKIAILTENGTLIVSDVINRKQFSSNMEYDLTGLEITGDIIESAGKVTEGMSWNKFIISFLASSILTLIIEILFAFIVGFTFKKSFKVLLVTNILTQIILNIIVFYFYNSLGQMYILFGIVIGEIIVIIAEMIVYSKYLIEKSESQRVLYAVYANLISIIIGYFIFII